MKKINLGIIGRNFGYNVAYKAIQKNKIFNVVGFSVKNKSIQKKIPNNIKIYKNWKELILDKKVNSVLIASPPQTHKKIIKLSIKNKKHIFCEKPVTTNLNDITFICNLLKKKKIINYVNYEFGNIEAFNFFKKNYLKKIKILNIHIDWIMKIPINKRSDWKDNHSKGGGNFFNYICHILYYLKYLFGEIDIISSQIKNTKNFKLESLILLKKKDIKAKINFKLVNQKSKEKLFHKIVFLTNKENYILETKLNNLKDQFQLKKNNKVIFKPKKIKHDFRLKPTFQNLKNFKKNILSKKSSSPDFNDAKKIHFLINKMIRLSQPK